MMGIAALIIGIVALVLGFVPLCNYFAVIPAIVGLILGIVEISKKSKKNAPKGLGIAGAILNAAAIVVILVWTLAIAAGAKEAGVTLDSIAEDIKTEVERAAEEVEAAAEAAEAEDAE